MARNLLANDLTVDNIDDAEFTKEVDPVDTLRRIGKEWKGLRLKCTCRSNQACCVCEIDYLLEEAFALPEYHFRGVTKMVATSPTNACDNRVAEVDAIFKKRDNRHFDSSHC